MEKIGKNTVSKLMSIEIILVLVLMVRFSSYLRKICKKKKKTMNKNNLLKDKKL